MGSISPELSLDVRPTHVPKTISEFLGELTAIGSVSERLLRLDEFVKRLEKEMRKIDAFKRELPLCMLLLNDAILALNEESEQCRAKYVQPVLEEFMPLKKNCDEEGKSETERENDRKDKMNWLSSVQLWNAGVCKNIYSKYDQKQNLASHEKVAEETCRLDDPFQSRTNRTSSRAFMLFKNRSGFPIPVTRKEEKVDAPVAGLSLLTPGIKNPREENSCNGFSKTTSNQSVSSSINSGRGGSQAPAQQQTARKQRRCWSPELHRRFVNALQRLGGSQAATPKHIRELMQVDGLTNDEVKSHLQKYRLHSRRVPTATATASNQSMVSLGNLRLQQDQYGESLKQTSSQSGSPQGPLQLAGTGGGTSTTGGDSIEEEEEEEEEEDDDDDDDDDKEVEEEGEESESYSWKSHVHVSRKDDV